MPELARILLLSADAFHQYCMGLPQKAAAQGQGLQAIHRVIGCPDIIHDVRDVAVCICFQHRIKYVLKRGLRTLDL